MRRRIISISLLLVMCLSVLLYIPTPVQASTVTDNDIINAVLVVFNYNEGTYDSVNRNDNGALSIGKLQWHGQRALELMKDVVAADPAAAQQLLGESLYYEITGAASGAWNSRTLSQSEAAGISVLLATDASRSIQDALARKDISAYISHGRAAGVRTEPAMVYYCDLENQYGPGGAGSLLTRIKNRLGKTTIDTLEEFHTTLLQVTSYYHSRRNWVYGYCSSIDWSNVSQSAGNGYAALRVLANLDVQPPTISGASAICLSADTFRVEVEATDNVRVSDCRVEVSAQTENKAPWAAYAVLTGETWSLDFSAGDSFASAERFFITVTVSDASGNGASTKLEVTRQELLAAQETSTDPCQDGHNYTFLYSAEATCIAPGYRVEQCSECFETRNTRMLPANGYRFLTVSVPAIFAHGGYIHYTSEDCNEQTTTSTSSATEHSWTQWRINKSTAMMERRCTECGTVQAGTEFMAENMQ